MKLENQVCSLEQAKRLKQLGIEQVGVFAWCPDGADEADMFVAETNTDGEGGHFADGDEYSAYTVAELGVMLTAKSTHGRSTVGIDALPEYTEKNGWYWWPSLSANILDPNYLVQLSADTQAKMYADVLIYRLENKLTTAEEVNQRLQTA